MSRWFKIPVGTAQNAVFGITAKKFGLSTPHVIGIFTAAADLFAENKKIDEVAEILAFTYNEPEQGIKDILLALQTRGIFDAEFSISGIEKTTPDAERKAAWRARKKAETGQSQDSPVTVTGQPRDGHRTAP